jgi:uncharacterized protein
MALTNYLAASILTTVVVLVAGNYGRVSTAIAAGLGLALWVAEVVWSGWWLRAYALGPAEWAWRKLASTPAKT